MSGPNDAPSMPETGEERSDDEDDAQSQYDRIVERQ